MRPLELRLSGFRSYDEETVDLSRLGLVVITGDTGAGKTSLLDAICFALYGCTPEQSGPKELLTLGRAHGEVRLTFAKDGRRHRVTRRFGKEAPEPGHLLETLDEDGAVEARVVGEAAVSEAVRAIVGLTFGAFTSAVLLAQGRFAQFLGSAPRARDDILRELFDVASLEGARVAAQSAKAAAAAEADVLARERQALPAHPAAARARAASGSRGVGSAGPGAVAGPAGPADRVGRRRRGGGPDPGRDAGGGPGRAARARPAGRAGGPVGRDRGGDRDGRARAGGRRRRPGRGRGPARRRARAPRRRSGRAGGPGRRGRAPARPARG